MANLSVIIPLYNKGKYIGRALNSVLAQTYEDFEVVVVDDGSGDDGPDIVRQYKDKRLRLIQQENAGPGAARNRGIAETTGNYIAFLDADDEWLPDFLKVTLYHLNMNNDCVLCTVGYIDGRTGKSSPHNRRMTYGRWELPLQIEPREMKDALDVIQSGCTVLCHREALLEFKGFYENRCTYGEDGYLWLQVILNYPIFRDPSPRAIYHAEASTLGIFGRNGICPPRPILTDPEPIRKVCPPRYRKLLESYLVYWAQRTRHAHLINT
ncbi:MAG: glycosyltransferase [Phycisphaerae bacterium]|nr:glycosyltransferase family 2 protein [Phycisphaerae bacterium]NIT57842.1 glycosyltransferase family 2 protein [Fodinibius sp.]NIU58806.1 glycosyltransferase [Phycisphaerae bacterium]NIV12715.1 glycosyltransferase [Fodinibius sp.]NIW95079.1 glycosyltransferase [Phycisphaerae bacterium]